MTEIPFYTKRESEGERVGKGGREGKRKGESKRECLISPKFLSLIGENHELYTRLLKASA